MIMSKVLLMLSIMFTMAGISYSADDGAEDLAFIDFLKGYCAEPLVIAPLPHDRFQQIIDNAYIGCTQRFGIASPCVGKFVAIQNKDGSFRMEIVCSPIPNTETPTPLKRIH